MMGKALFGLISVNNPADQKGQGTKPKGN